MINSADANQEQSHLFAKPTKCIALRQGQVCYQKVMLTWLTAKTGAYCLYKDNDATPLQCWQQLSEGSFRLDLQSDKNVSFYLKDQQTQKTVAQTTISIAWVYKSRKQQKSGWRLF